MGADWVDEQRETVARRAEFIELLDETGPLKPRDVVEQLDYSRSTVTRALRELRDSELVERRDDGYAATVAGVMVVNEHRRHEAASRAILNSKDLLEPLPDAESLPPKLLVGGEIDLADESGPFRPLERISEQLREAEEIRAHLPTLINPNLLRVWHRRVTGERVNAVGIFDADLLAQLKGQYPQLLSGMAVSDGFTAFSGDGAQYGLVLTRMQESSTVSVVVYHGESGIRGVVSNDSEPAVEWARHRLQQLRETASDVTEDLVSLAEAVDQRPAAVSSVGSPDVRHSGVQRDGGFAGHALPLDLKTEGFVRLSTEYFEGRDNVSPEVSWRTGFTLADVYAGHAADRFEDGQRFTDRLVEQLQTGSDHVVLGPAGSGKSTVCKSVACEWYERQLGPVLYRERGRGDSFDSPAVLEAYLRQLDNHALVVVEDAIRGEANDVFEVMRAVGNRDDVTFLLDARTEEWNDPDEFALEPRVDAFRRSSVERIIVPTLEEGDCARFVETFERLVDEDIDLSGTELASTVHSEEAAEASKTPEPAETLIIQNRLTRRVRPLPGADASTDVLEADIEQTCQSLVDADVAFALDLAVLVNLLNAAGVPVATEYLYALAPEGEYSQIDEAVSHLEGMILFNRQAQGRHGTEYRAYHELWSTMFLEQTLDVLAEGRAHEVFGRCVSRLLAMADDADRRDRIERHCSGVTPHLHRIEAEPEGWADEVTERIFSVGTSRARLAPLYGESHGDTIVLPAACSELTRLEQSIWRAEMNWKQGELERAEYEIERLLDAASSADDASEREATRLQSHGYSLLGRIEVLRGEHGRSIEYFERSLSLAEEIGDFQAQAEARVGLANTEGMEGNFSEAKEHTEKLREIAKQHELPKQEAAAVHIHATILHEEGKYEEGRRLEKEALELARESSSKEEEAASLGNLGVVALAENRFESAESYLFESLEIYRDRGFEQGKEFVYTDLGEIARKRGELDDAEEYLQQALSLARENQTQLWIAGSSSTLAHLEYDRGNLSAAESYARDTLEIVTEETSHQYQSEAHRRLARIAIRREDFETAESHLQEARTTGESFGHPLILADCDEIRSELELTRDELAVAERRAKDSLDRYDDYAMADVVAKCYRVLGLVALERGDTETAAEHLNEGLEKAEQSGVVRTIGELQEAVARLEATRGNTEEHRTHRQKAVDTFERLGDTERVRQIETKRCE